MLCLHFSKEGINFLKRYAYNAYSVLCVFFALYWCLGIICSIYYSLYLDTTGVYLISLACQLGCSVFTSTSDQENLQCLEHIFPHIRVLPGDHLLQLSFSIFRYYRCIPISLACQLGCSVFTSTSDQENLQCLEHIFPHIRVLPGDHLLQLSFSIFRYYRCIPDISSLSTGL